MGGWDGMTWIGCLKLVKVFESHKLIFLKSTN